MKYRILLLLALACAILVAAVGGTMAGYTDKAAFGFSIRPDVEVHEQAQQPIEMLVPENPGEVANIETDTPQQMSETEAPPQK